MKLSPEEEAAKKAHDDAVDEAFDILSKTGCQVADGTVEALADWNDHMVSINNVINYVREVKQSISQPVTVADNY